MSRIKDYLEMREAQMLDDMRLGIMQDYGWHADDDGDKIENELADRLEALRQAEDDRWHNQQLRKEDRDSNA